MIRCLAVAVVFAFLAGCGYQHGGVGGGPGGYEWRSLYREDVQTVAVPVFRTKDYRRGVEIRLTEAFVKQLEARSPYKVVPRERADTILEAELTNIDVHTRSRDITTNIPRELEMTLTVDFTWKDMRNGRILVQRRGFTNTAIYYPQLGEGEFVGSQQGLERMALLMVQELEADW